MSWGRKIIDGTKYDLTHLDSFIFPVICFDKSYRIQVSFGAHTFTRETRTGDSPDLLIPDGSKSRTFCIERYAHSLHLPSAVCAAVNGVVCLSRDTLVLDATLPGLTGPYLVVFNIEKARSNRFDVILRVRSAHHRPNLDRNLPTAKFTVVVSNSISGGKIRWTKK